MQSHIATISFHVFFMSWCFSDTQVWKLNVLGFSSVFCWNVTCEHCSFWYNVVALFSIKVNKYFKKTAALHVIIKLQCCSIVGGKQFYHWCHFDWQLDWPMKCLELWPIRARSGRAQPVCSGSYRGMQENRRSVLRKLNPLRRIEKGKQL